MQSHTITTARLGGIRPLVVDHDERPSREDLGYGQTIFTRQAFALPTWLTGGRRSA